MSVDFGGAARRLASVVVLVVVLVGPASAWARGDSDSTYRVNACAESAEHVFKPGHSDAGFRTRDSCPGTRQGNTGITIQTQVRAGKAPFSAVSEQVFKAPAGTTITRASLVLNAVLRGGWRAQAYTTRGDPLADCPRHGCRMGSLTRPGGAQAAAGRPPKSVRATNAVILRLICVSRAGCAYTYGGATVGVGLVGASFEVTDTSKPKLAPGGVAVGKGYLSGSQAIKIQAIDGSGVREIALLVPGRSAPVAVWHPRRLSGTNRNTAWPSLYEDSISTTLNTRLLPDGGPARLQLRLVDGLDNQSVTDIALYVDNTPPQPPVLTAYEGQHWWTSPAFHFTWSPKPDLSGVTWGETQLCMGNPPWTCGPIVGVPSLVTSWQRYDVLALGQRLFRVRMRDGAGNAGAWQAAFMRYDNVVPGAGKPKEKNGWFNREDVATKAELIEQLPPNPISGVAGYAVSVAQDGTALNPPGYAVNTLGNQYPVRSLSRTGVWWMAARALSAAGLWSLTYGIQKMSVDVDAPSARASTGYDLSQWIRQPVAVTVIGVDPGQGSGMGPAPSARPVHEGAYVTYAIDGTASEARGSQTTATIAAEGTHSFRFHATDLAGNHSPDQTLGIRIDRTPPDQITIAAARPSDPRDVAVRARDELSGLAGGEVQVRHQGTTQWLNMPTSLAAGQLVAQIRDEGLPDGPYDVRALVRDGAGNVGVGDTRGDGSPAVVTFPLRTPTQLLAGPEAPRCHRHPCLPRVGLGAVRAAYSRPRTLVGLLQTTAQRPLASQQVRIASQLSTGGPFREMATVRTDGRGRFRFRAAKGPSRTLRFSFLGTGVLRASDSDVRLAVPAHSSITVSRTRIRSGRTVFLRGRLPGPLPSGPLVVVPQAYFRGGWHPVGKSTTTDRKGRWSMPYSFLASTRGSFAFRAEIPHQAAYPYERGHSRTVWVRVVG